MDVYWSGRIALVRKKDNIPLYNKRFQAFFLDIGENDPFSAEPESGCWGGVGGRDDDGLFVAGLHFPVDSAGGRLLGRALAVFLVARATGTKVHERGFDGRLFEGPNGEPLDFSLHQSMDHTSGNAYTRSASTTGVGNAPLLNWLWEEALKEWA